jgi:hypothetical protein
MQANPTKPIYLRVGIRSPYCTVALTSQRGCTSRLVVRPTVTYQRFQIQNHEPNIRLHTSVMARDGLRDPMHNSHAIPLTIRRDGSGFIYPTALAGHRRHELPLTKIPLVPLSAISAAAHWARIQIDE